MVKNPPAMQEMRVRFPGWEDPLEKEMETHSSILVWRIHGQRSLVDYSPWRRKESGTTEQLVPTCVRARTHPLPPTHTLY